MTTQSWSAKFDWGNLCVVGAPVNGNEHERFMRDIIWVLCTGASPGHEILQFPKFNLNPVAFFSLGPTGAITKHNRYRSTLTRLSINQRRIVGTSQSRGTTGHDIHETPTIPGRSRDGSSILQYPIWSISLRIRRGPATITYRHLFRKPPAAAVLF
jgi:hypothetical protein